MRAAGGCVRPAGGITAYYRDKVSVTIDASALEHASLLVNGAAAELTEGVAQVTEEDVITVAPAAGYAIDAVSCNDGSDHAITADDTGAYKFTMPGGDVTVTATYTQISPIFTGTAVELGGVLNLRFYVTYPDGWNASGDVVAFSVNGGAVSYVNGETDGNGRYFACPVNAYQMADPITAVYYHDEQELDRLEGYTVRANLSSLTSEATPEKARNLARAAMNFGHTYSPSWPRRMLGRWAQITWR